MTIFYYYLDEAKICELISNIAIGAYGSLIAVINRENVYNTYILLPIVKPWSY